jgi:hypothetical protein
MDLDGRLIFLASPGGLDAERAAVEATIHEFNQTHALDQQVTFVTKRWEDLAGGVGRPQSRINPHLDQCDFMILLMGDRWGSPPDRDGKWGAGTEEEFHRCLDLLYADHAYMRDLLVLFKTIDPDRLREPSPQLQAVMGFRNTLDLSKTLMYNTFDSLQSLSTSVHRKLTEWVQPLPERVPIRIVLEPGDAPAAPPTSASEALAAAIQLWSQGLQMQAEAAFAVAIENDDPQALAMFALFMRRTGRVDRALALNDQLLANQKLLASADPESMAYRVNALANIGIIHRKRGDLAQSRAALHEAVRTARLSMQPINHELCYALDNYGHTLLRLDEPDSARVQFLESGRIRQQYGIDTANLAQSSVNLARTELTLGDAATAEAGFAASIEQMSADSDEHLLANALAGSAEARLRQASDDGALDLLTQAGEINRRLHNSDGSSIVHGLLSRYYLRVAGRTNEEADLGNAERHAVLCEQESDKTGNVSGRGTAALLRAEVACARGQAEVAQGWLAEAERFAQESNNRLLLGDVAELATRLRQLAPPD